MRECWWRSSAAVLAYWPHQHSRIDADEALMRQALDAVKQLVDEKADYMIRNKLGNPYAEHTTKQGTAAITALRKRLESSK